MKYFAFILPLFVSSCVFLPVTAEKQKYYDKCKMATKKLTLEPYVGRQYSICDKKNLKEDLLFCLIASGVISSASIVVSGSIVLVGNTIHWLEHKSGCDPKNTKVVKEKALKEIDKSSIYINIELEEAEKI